MTQQSNLRKTRHRPWMSRPTIAESPAEEDFSLTAGDQVVDGAFGEQPAHPRVVEFLHTGGVKDFVDFLSKGEPISDIWRIQGEEHL